MARLKLPELLENDELERLLAAARSAGPRDAALVNAMAYGGLRVAEACRLRWEDLRADPPRLLVQQGKGSKDRFVPIHPRLSAAMEELRGVAGRVRKSALLRNGPPVADRAEEVAADRPEGQSNYTPDDQHGTYRSGGPMTGWVFPGRRDGPLTTRAAEYIVARLSRAAGIPRAKAHPHALRHTVATRLLRATGNLELVKVFLGHASIATTQIYTHLAVDDVAAGLEQLD